MHIPDGIITIDQALIYWILTILIMAICFYKFRDGFGRVALGPGGCRGGRSYLALGTVPVVPPAAIRQWTQGSLYRFA